MENTTFNTVFMTGILIFIWFMCMAQTAICFIIYNEYKKLKKDMLQITEYITDVNNKNYRAIKIIKEQEKELEAYKNKPTAL